MSRILIVDDNPTNLRLAASVLELEGHQVDQAADADQALDYLSGTVPDLILMDIALPGTDGLTLTRRIKAEPRLAAIPVVALTAFAMKGDDQKAREAGCIGYVTKPIDTREFGRQLAGFLAPPAQRLLIVDDNPTNLRLLRAQLEAEGKQVVEAANGVEALELLADTPVDGVISDILMPRMDGYRLCLALRRHPRFGALPFVLYTSTYNSPADRDLATSAGADAYVAKPAPVGVLLAALDAARGRQRAPSAPGAELETPVLKQYSEILIRKLEEKSEQLGLAYEGLAQIEARLSGLVESALDAIIAIDQQQKIVLFNSAAEKLFGCPREQAMNRSLDQFIPVRFQRAHHSQVEKFGEGADTGRRMGARMVWAQRLDGTEFPVDASISKLATSHGWLYTVFLRDISERYQAEQALAKSEARLRRVNRVLSVLSGINTLIVRAGNQEELLTEACRIAVDSGHFPRAWIALMDGPDDRLRFRAGQGDDPAFFTELEQLLADQDSPRYAAWLAAVKGRQPLVINDLAAEPLMLPSTRASGARSLAALPLSIDGAAAGVMVLYAAEPGFFDSEEMKLLSELAGDVSYALEHLRKSEQIHYLATHDELTGLPNRSAFSDRLARSLKDRNGAGAQMLSVLVMDLERFRLVNETLGREAGDELLRQVARRLTAAEDSVARLNGDVFVMKLRDPQSAAEVAHAVNALVERCFGASYAVAGEELRIGCRIGIAVHPSDGRDAETLLHNAEAALRRARVTSERLAFYAPELNARAAEALNLESRLRRAIERNEFVLHYQPKVGMADRRITGVEALIRWRSPDQPHLVPPGQFIPVLEECGLIGEVGDWALRQALADQDDWWSRGLVAPRVAVNVSPLQLRRPGFAESVAALTSGSSMAELELEITESVIMEDVERNIVALSAARDAGITVAVDDFGTGYSSLAYIAKLPVNALKIDRSFIVGMTDGPEGLAIVSSIIALAHALRLKVVAEGVETEEQARLLHLLRCDEAQGYLFTRPVPAADIVALLMQRKPLGGPK
ncbi:EAL domain-containing protein [Arenimonas terrae]|uniref:EAL domain-containing protein n=1 Tax=Arenimonas terrae TaxID=2546226 RepID=A0A5C4RPC3_9GAMM|nr:EAL domain-containing protein [Arenimonas terrae]TNJ33106.1 EAL domain-containing protein [Arenimonas terrae]